MTVEERLAALALEYGLRGPAVEALARLLSALAAEPDPHTAVVESRQAVDYHIADSLTALAIPAVRDAESVADIGAGAGFPGLPLAIALPSTQVDLIESVRRKCGVIQRLAAAAALGNARPLAVRAETWAAGDGRGAYDVATARAVAPLAVLVEYAAPLLRLGGTFVAWKGVRDSSEETAGHIAAELVGLEPSEVVRVRPYDAARDLNLHLYLKVKETPERFPRRPGIAAKRPLA